MPQKPIDDELDLQPLDLQSIQEPSWWDSITNTAQGAINSPTFQRFLYGPEEFRNSLGPPQNETPLLPSMQGVAESRANQGTSFSPYWEGFGQSLYQDILRPFTTPSGIVGSSGPARLETPSPKLLTAGKELAEESTPLVKRQLRMNKDGTFTDKSTGEIIDRTGKPVVTEPTEILPPSESHFQTLDDGTVVTDPEVARWLDIEKAQRQKPQTDLRAWADHEAFRDSQIEKGLPDSGPFKEGIQRLPDIDLDLQPIQAPGESIRPSFVGSKKNPTLGAKLGEFIKSESGEASSDINPYLEAYNLPRGTLASWDLSFPGRQGLGLIHKKEYWKSFVPMIKSLGSEGAYEQIQNEIFSRPMFQRSKNLAGKETPSFAEQAGLKLTGLSDLAGREEAIMSQWAEKVPGVRASNRAYTAFANKLRADTFEGLVNKYGTMNDMVASSGLAEFVNTATGRASMGKLEKYAPLLNQTLFSPRLITSRLKTLNPNYYIMLPKAARIEALKSLAAITLGGTGLVSLASQIPGVEVGYDPTKADFGKIKIGNTRIDVFGGYQQYAVAASKMIDYIYNGAIKGNQKEYGTFKKPTAYDTLLRFGESKLHPTLGFIKGMLSGRTFTGQPFKVGPEIVKLFVPMVMQDMYDLYEKGDPKLFPIAAPAATIGMGVQTYGGKQNKLGRMSHRLTRPSLR